MSFHTGPKTCTLFVLVAVASCAAPSSQRSSDPLQPSTTAYASNSWSRSDQGSQLHARTAADLLRCCLRARHLRAARNPAGNAFGARPPRLLLVIDNVPVRGLDWLHFTPAEDVERLRVLSPAEAVALFGSRAAGGAIIVETRRGRRAPG